jgi:peptidoglycan biosynthesis protein MviN/MurJ (putative lipid II flippase)
MVDGFMAEGLLPNGGPSVLYYATRVQQLPMSLVSAAATAAVFPALRHSYERRNSELRKLHDDTHSRSPSPHCRRPWEYFAGPIMTFW